MVILAALFSFLTFVNELDQVGKGTYSAGQALGFVFLTLPTHLITLLPVAVLLGCLLSLSSLARTRELTALQALGVTDRQIAWALGRATLFVVMAALALMELVTPPLERYAYRQRAEALSEGKSLPTSRGLWARRGREVIHIRGLDQGQPTDVDLFRLNASRSGLTTHIHADRARIRGSSQWLLEDAVRRRFTKEGVQVSSVPVLPWQSFLDPDRLDQLVLPPRSLAPSEAYHYIQNLQARGQEARQYVQTFWRKLTMPIAAAAMMLLALAMTFSLLDRATTSGRLLMGSIVGLTFYLIDNLIASFGLLWAVPTVFSAVLPRLTALLFGVILFIKVTGGEGYRSRAGRATQEGNRRSSPAQRELISTSSHCPGSPSIRIRL